MLSPAGFVSTLDLLPRLLSRAEHSDSSTAGGAAAATAADSDSPLRKRCVEALSHSRWPSACAVGIAQTLHELPLTTTQLACAARRVLRHMASRTDANALPALAYQLLLLLGCRYCREQVRAISVS